MTIATTNQTCTIPNCNRPLATGSLVACVEHWPTERRHKCTLEFFAWETIAIPMWQHEEQQRWLAKERERFACLDRVAGQIRTLATARSCS